jgi:hypothetical protein
MTTLIIYPNKLDLSVHEFVDIPHGQTLNTFLSGTIEHFFVSDTPPFSVKINDQLITPEEWGTWVLEPHDIVKMYAEAKDPITATLVVIAVIAAGAAIYMASQIPDNYQTTIPSASSIYSVNSQGNEPRLMGCIPQLFGKHKIYPDLITEPEWFYSGDEEYLHLALAVSVGQLDFTSSNIIISDTPVSTYASDITFQKFSPGADVSAHPAHYNTYTSREVSSTSGTTGIEVETVTNSYFACPSAEVTNKIIIDVSFDDGIGYVNDDSSVSAQTVTFNIEWRQEGTVTWVVIPKSRSAATRDQLGNTYEISLGRWCRPEVRLRRTSASNANNSRYLESITWRRLKCRLPTVTKYDEFTTLMMTIHGTNTLSTKASNKLGVIATRKLPVPDGNGGWTSTLYPTRDIAPVIRYIILDSGLSESVIPNDELLRLHDLWVSRGDHFDAVFSDFTTLFEALKKVMAVGYAEPTLNYGQIVPVRDEPRSVWDHQYSPDNMLGDGLEVDVKLIDDSEPDGVEVEFTDPSSWKSDTILCLLDGDFGSDPEKIRAFGITDKNKAHQFGMRYRSKKRFRRISYSFKTEMDAFNSEYLDYVALADNIPGYTQSGRVEDYLFYDGQVHLTLNKPLEWGSGVHHIALRKPDGKTSGPYVAIKQLDPYKVVIDGTLDFKPNLDGSMEPPFFIFGESDGWCYPALITDVTPQGTEKCSVKAVNYHPSVYLFDDDSPYVISG